MTNKTDLTSTIAEVLENVCPGTRAHLAAMVEEYATCYRLDGDQLDDITLVQYALHAIRRDETVPGMGTSFIGYTIDEVLYEKYSEDMPRDAWDS